MGKKVEDFIAQQKLVSVQMGATVAETMTEMGKGRVGTIVILKGSSLKGVFSERDVVRRVYSADLSPETTSIDSVMTTKVSTVRRNHDSRRCLFLLHKFKCRSLPVIEWWNQAVGVVSIIDVLMDLTDALQAEQEEFFKLSNRELGFHFSPYPKQNQLKDLVRSQSLKNLGPQNSVFDAIQLMADANIGSILVMEDGQLAGILSERDVLFKVAAAGLNPRDIKLTDVMTKAVTTIDAGTTNLECLLVMKRIGCRHLPVSESGKIVGVVSILNCLQWMFDEFSYYVEKWRTMALVQDNPPA